MTAPERRSIELEVEVPGTPEQVWEAIATGPGITAWFAPADVDGREGGAVSYDMGTGEMEPSGAITEWDPPRRFAHEEEWRPFETEPAARLATEWIVEARSGGTCVVRLVTSGWGTGADWDREIGNMRDGWGMYLDNLRLYLTHFPGRECSWVMAGGRATGSIDDAWTAVTTALGIHEPREGERAAVTAPGAPSLAGVVERDYRAEHQRAITLRIDEPGPGIATVFVHDYHDESHANVQAYLFGDGAPGGAARDQAAWRTWMEEHFPSTEA